MEGMIEKKERERRRKNVVIRELEVKEGKRKERMEMLLEKMEVRTEIEEVRTMGSGGGEGEEMVVVRLAKEEQKWEIMKRKDTLRGKKERIGEDWTWREWKMR